MKRRLLVLIPVGAVVVSCFSFLFNAGARDAARIGQPVLTRQIPIKDERQSAVIEPKALLQSRDGGYVIAGRIRATQSAWVVKVDRSGKVLWRYDREIEPQFRKPFEGGAAFTSVIEMTDGSFLLCGRVERPKAPRTEAFTVHLDAEGRLITDKLIAPSTLGLRESDRASPGFIYAHRLIRWGNDVALLGSGFRNVEDKTRPSGWKDALYYWVAKVDSNGSFIWVREYLALSSKTIFGISSAIVTPTGSLAFTGALSLQSEILQIGVEGDAEVQVLHPALTRFAVPVVPNGTVETLGLRQHLDQKKDAWDLAVLDSRLNATSITTGPGPRDFEWRDPDVFRLPDRSLVMFGSVSAGASRPTASRVVVVSSTLQDEAFLDPTSGALVDDAVIGAAIPTGLPSEFAMVRGLRKGSHANGDLAAQVGVTLDFVQIK